MFEEDQDRIPAPRAVENARTSRYVRVLEQAEAMETSLIAANVGALATTGLGAMGLLAPERAASFTSIAPVGPNGRSEIRATYGGLFAAMGGWCLLSQSPALFAAAGVAWLGAAAGRTASVMLDGNHDVRNLGGVVFEAAIGALLLAGSLAAA